MCTNFCVCAHKNLLLKYAKCIPKVYCIFITIFLLQNAYFIRNVCLSGHASLPLDREVSRVCMLSCQTQQQVRPSDDAGFSGIPKLRSDLTQNFGDCLFTVYWSKIIKASFVLSKLSAAKY